MIRVRPIAGGIGGLVATVPMSIAMLALHKLLPRHERYDLPPERITKRATRKIGFGKHLDESELSVLTVLGHFGYGAAAGTLYAPVSRLMPGPSAASGIAYGLLVWATSYLGLLPALGLLSSATQHPARRNALMIVAHIIWGAVLGLVVKWFEQEQA